MNWRSQVTWRRARARLPAAVGGPHGTFRMHGTPPRLRSRYRAERQATRACCPRADRPRYEVDATTLYLRQFGVPPGGRTPRPALRSVYSRLEAAFAARHLQPRSRDLHT